MNQPLAAALDQSSHLLDQALVAARAELADLDVRRNELIALIERAESVRRSHAGNDDERRRPMTLHEAMALVLHEHGNRWMSIRDLGNEVNQRDLYRKRDGTAVDSNQFHARIKNYSHLFERNGPNVRLRDVAQVA